jgi:hypothetical protein
MKFTRISYQLLNARQRENYNFQKVSGVLADYGFATIRLTADFQGADFLAQHINGKTILPIQLKGRAYFSKKYLRKRLWICFPSNGGLYLFPHDRILNLILNSGRLTGTVSWAQNGVYHFPSIPAWLKPTLQPYFLQ